MAHLSELQQLQLTDIYTNMPAIQQLQNTQYIWLNSVQLDAKQSEYRKQNSNI